jgi:hypothetical protein
MLPFVSRCRTYFPVEVVEPTQLIGVEIHDPELAQVPRFVRHFLDDRPRVFPALEQFVDFPFADEIQLERRLGRAAHGRRGRARS